MYIRLNNFILLTAFIIAGMLLLALPVTANADASLQKSERAFCDSVNQKFKDFGWNSIICNADRWMVYDYSAKGNPLLYQEFGFNDPDNDGPVNLILCGVHGDETPSIYLCMQLTRHILFDSPQTLKDFKVVIAPIVNPDGFFANTRHNSNGIDVNRNLPTKDWDKHAQSVWERYNKDPRKFPGKQSGSEIESRMQADLIEKYQPDKIISVHAPLGFLDYDGPGDQKYYNLIRVEQRARFLGTNIEANSRKLVKFVDYQFFPGSLGNYAGNEREIPTYTVELPTVKASEAHNYWSDLKYALVKALRFKVYDKQETNPFYAAKAGPRKALHVNYEPVAPKTQEKIPETTTRSIVQMSQEMSGYEYFKYLMN